MLEKRTKLHVGCVQKYYYECEYKLRENLVLSEQHSMLKMLQKFFWRTVMTRNFSTKLHLERTNIDICVAVAVVATTEEGGGTCGCGTTAVLVLTKCCKSTTT